MATNLGDLLRAKGFAATPGKPDAPAPTTPTAAEPAFAAKVVVRRSKKGRGGKTVTEVQGITAGAEAVAKGWKKMLGVGARVEDDLVVVQGDQRDRIAKWLEGQGVKKVVVA